MANLTSVTLTAGVPTAGTGTVGTIDNVTGTAGSPSVPVLTVQGVASGTAQPVSLSTVPALVAGSAIIGKVGIDQTTPGTTNLVALAANQSVNNAQIAGVTTATGSGAMNTGTQRIAIATDSPGVINVGTAGSAASNVVTVQGIASMTPVNTTQTVTATANGGTASRVNAAASTNATSLKASAGQLYTIDVFNAAAYNVFLKFYNKASAPTVGSDTPVMTIPVQAGGGYSKTWSMGLPFATGIAYAITKLQADSDTTVVAAGDLTGNTLWI
jgi:hypothetical protein